MKDFKPTVMMTKLECICLPRAGDGWPLRHCCPHAEWRQSAATPAPTHSQRSLQELTAVVTEGEGSWLGWRRCCAVALRALLVASVVRSPRINIQEQQQKKKTPKTTDCRCCCGQNSTLRLCITAAVWTNCTHLNLCLKIPQLWSCKSKNFNLLSSFAYASQLW